MGSLVGKRISRLLALELTAIPSNLPKGSIREMVKAIEGLEHRGKLRCVLSQR